MQLCRFGPTTPSPYLGCSTCPHHCRHTQQTSAVSLVLQQIPGDRIPGREAPSPFPDTCKPMGNVTRCALHCKPGNHSRCDATSWILVDKTAKGVPGCRPACTPENSEWSPALNPAVGNHLGAFCIAIAWEEYCYANFRLYGYIERPLGKVVGCPSVESRKPMCGNKKTNEMKTWFFWKSNKRDKILARLNKKKEMKISKIRKETGHHYWSCRN